MAASLDLIVLGAGSGGLAMAFRAAKHGARVALLEPRDLDATVAIHPTSAEELVLME